MRGFWYLATPYSGHPLGISEAHLAACRQATLLAAAGVPIYCPIAHTHSIAVHGNLDPSDHGLWLPLDEPLARAAEGLIVCMLPGWDRSRGVAAEIGWLRGSRRPVVYMTPGEVPEELSGTSP